jgi:peptide/nickel transport system ATP-binding protein
VTASGAPTASGNGAAGRPSDVRLQVRELEIRRGRLGPAVVSGVSFGVRPGDVLGLVGESGSGKTTVALALLGHIRRGLSVGSGEICLDGVDLLRLGPGELRRFRGARVSYVPQDPTVALNPALRIGYQLRETLRVHSGVAGDQQARVLEVMHEVRLDPTPDMLRRYPHQLSGGQQQRVSLAMAFACRPSLIVLDEPTTGLDVTTQRHVLDTIRRLCRDYRVAAVYVSHDLAVVSELVAEVAVMYAGRIVEAGATAPLFREPLHPYTRGLLTAVPTPEYAGRLTGIPGQQPLSGRRGPGCAFAPRCDLTLGQCRAHEPEPVRLDGRPVRCLRAATLTSARSGLRGPAPSAATAAPQAAILSVRGVWARYGGVPVLSGVDLDVLPQACVAVVGESGSGKTTLARCILGLHMDWTGAATLHGVPLARTARARPRPVLKQIQCVLQNPYTSLNPRKTVGQIVAEPLQRFLGVSRREQTERVVGVLEDVALGSGLLSRYPDQLSGGERQRVAIARALVVEPDLLVCDEVTSALDVSVQAVVIELLGAVQAQRRLAMIFITHNLALVRSVAQSAVVLRRGSVVEAGPVEQILTEPGSQYTAHLLADVPKLVT